MTRLPFFLLLEERLQDGCFSFRGNRFSETRVVLVTLDPGSLEALRKPLLFTSPELAEAVTYLKSQGAASIGLDLILPQSYADLPELQAGAVGDSGRMGQAILDAGNVVLPEMRVQDRWLSTLPQWRLKSFLAPDAKDIGFANWTEDGDHFLRRQQLVINEKGQQRLQFALALVARARGWEAEWTEDGLQLGGMPVLLDGEQRLRINYVGPPGSFPEVSLGAVLAAARKGAPLPVDVAGAIVIVGATSRDQQDFHATPFSNSYWLSMYGGPEGLMSGSEIHANIAATLLDRAFLRSPSWLTTLLFLLAFGALLGRLFARLNMTWGLLLFAGHHVAWRWLCLWLFAGMGLRFIILPVLVLGVLVYGLTLLQRWRLLRLMLGVVKSEKIARLLEEDPGQLDLHGEERVVTLLFADIRSFTPFAESHSPREVVALLNAYFGAIVPIIERHGGTLNQYMGDGIMVIFGAPVTQPDQAVRAVRAAVEVIRCVHAMQQRWAELGFPGLRMGVGIHTGRVVVGTVGSPDRLDYSAIGDTTNTTARIEAKNKEFGTEILISDETYQILPDDERRRLGCCAAKLHAEVKGKDQPLELHKVAEGAG